jgi:H+-translocating NAD(P) transhydrogenase subunit alpha
MKIAVLKETAPGETRCAAIPETVKKFIRLGAEIAVESGAGAAAGITDSDFEAAGAGVGERAKVLAGADAILCINGPDASDLKGAKTGALLVGALDPLRRRDTIDSYAKAGFQALAMEWMPRITRAQSMDILSSQSNLVGYKAVVDAAAVFGRAFPMMMTAAGTVSPAKVFVMGVGVAGLQAIATAKRLGAVVSAYDVRPASADEVRSMGGTFLELDLEAVEGAGGYARELSVDRAERQQQLLAPYVADADVLITTAAVPGRRAPLLVAAPMLAAMKAGSVVIDLAAESGGNVEGAVAGEDLAVGVPGGAVRLVGMKDAASTMPVDASRLYARNVTNLLLLMTKDGNVIPNFDDEVVAGTCLTHAGEVRHAPTAELLAAASTERSTAGGRA